MLSLKSHRGQARRAWRSYKSWPREQSPRNCSLSPVWGTLLDRSLEKARSQQTLEAWLCSPAYVHATMYHTICAWNREESCACRPPPPVCVLLKKLSNCCFSYQKLKGVSDFYKTSKEKDLALHWILLAHTSSACMDYDMPLGDCSLILRGHVKEVETGMSYFWDFL